MSDIDLAMGREQL